MSWKLYVLVGTHLAVALFVNHWKDRSAEIRQLKLERTSLQVQVKVLENDAVEAAVLKKALRDYDLKVKELSDALEDADRVCFDEPDARRVRDLFK